MKQQRKDDAVSPVVGVMLMLVVTIIIAAVVAVFAGGLGGNVEKTPTITCSVTMDDNGLVLTCTGADTALTYGKDFYIRINHPQDLDKFTDPLDLANATSGNGAAFKPGNAIYYSTPDLTNAYLVLNTTYPGEYKSGNNGKCWTWGGSNGATIGLPVKVQLVDSNGKVLATGTGKCTRTD